MKKAIIKVYLKLRAIVQILRGGSVVTYLPMDIMERVGYVHVEVTSKDCDEIVNKEFVAE